MTEIRKLKYSNKNTPNDAFHFCIHIGTRVSDDWLFDELPRRRFQKTHFTFFFSESVVPLLKTNMHFSST